LAKENLEKAKLVSEELGKRFEEEKKLEDPIVNKS